MLCHSGTSRGYLLGITESFQRKKTARNPGRFSSAQVAHALFAVSCLAFKVRSRSTSFHGCIGQIPAERAGFLPNRITFGVGLVELVRTFARSD